MPKSILFLWDIDGTLLLTGGAGKAAFDRVFEEIFNEKYVWKNLIPDGRTDDTIIEELFFNRFGRLPFQDEMMKIVDRYNELMEEELSKAHNFRLMPYAEETLKRLSQKKDVVMGLVTGNYEISARHKLRRAGMNQYFPFGGFGCDSRDRQVLTNIALKRAIDYLGEEPKIIYAVGDTIYDIRCGKGIGAKTIAVATGYTSREELEAENPDWLFNDLSEFEKKIDQWIA